MLKFLAGAGVGSRLGAQSQELGVGVVNERLSAGHVEQAVSWFDRKFSSELETHRSHTWRQSPGRPVWIPGVKPDPSQWVRVGSGPVNFVFFLLRGVQSQGSGQE